MNMLYLSCEPSNFRTAVELLTREALRLSRYGVLEGEYNRAVFTFRKVLKQAAEQGDTTQSSTLIAELIDSTELDIAFISRAEQLELFDRTAKVINLDIVNRRMKSLFSGIGFGSTEDGADAKGKQDPGQQ